MYQRSRRLAQGRADDGARRELHANRAREGAAAVRGRRASTRRSSTDELQASELFARVLALDPEHVEAGEPLAELYFRDEQWAELEPDPRHAGAARSASCTPTQASSTSSTTGWRAPPTSSATPTRRSSYYKPAYDLDSTYLPTLLGRADLLYQDGGLGRRLQDLPDHPGPPPRLARTSRRSSTSSTASATSSSSRASARRRSTCSRRRWRSSRPTAPTLQAVIDLQQQQGDWEAVIHAKRGADGDRRASTEKVKLLDEIGDIYHEQAAEPAEGDHRLPRGARGRGRGPPRILHKVLDLYSETKQWKKAVEIIERIVDAREGSGPQGKYYHAAATHLPRRAQVARRGDRATSTRRSTASSRQPDKLTEANCPAST